MRPVPLALHESVEDAVCDLDQQGIWEPVGPLIGYPNEADR